MNDRDQELENMTAKMENMLMTNEELSLSKVKLEMKAVELEEQKDRLDEERKELIDNITQTRKHSEVSVLFYFAFFMSATLSHLFANNKCHTFVKKISLFGRFAIFNLKKKSLFFYF